MVDPAQSRGSQPTTQPSTLSLRDRPVPRVGFVVERSIMQLVSAEFAYMITDGGLHIAEGETPGGIGVAFVERPRSTPLSLDDGDPAVISAVRSLGIRQVVSLAHRILHDPVPARRHATEIDPPKGAASSEGLTVAIQILSVCNRLQHAVLDTANEERDINGVFLRPDDDDLDPAVVTEQVHARRNAMCIASAVATTLRADHNSRTSELTLFRMLLATPEAISPLGSCSCAGVRS